jgi:endonuclease/exonuclease/phosphatase (EEP) superfamily protein YafD
MPLLLQGNSQPVKPIKNGMRRSPPPSSRPILAVAAAIGLGLAASFYHGFWLSDLLSHFRLYGIAALLLVALLLLPLRRPRWAAVLALGSLGIGAASLPRSDFVVPTEGRTVYTALHLNLHEHNQNFQQLIALLDAEQPDFVSLVEYTETWDYAVSEALLERYPHHFIEPRRDLRGIVLLSRYPLERTLTVGLDGAHRPIALADAVLPEGTLTLMAVHAESPMSAERFASRNHTLDRLAATALSNLAEGRTVLAMGDFNCSPWSGNFAVLREPGQLQRPASRWRPAATWPASFGRFGIPIDHILLSRGLRAVEYRIGPNVGSDHLPVVCRFTVVQPPS